MIVRNLEKILLAAVMDMPVVALLGPRQVGKTTLAFDLLKKIQNKEVVYLDLELDSDLAQLDDPEAYFRRFSDKFFVIDEVQRKPDLFSPLRGLVDANKRKDNRVQQFLLLGSASRDLLQHSSESLAGRIRYLELSPFSITEIAHAENLGFNPEKLWFRGGFPDSYLAKTEEQSWMWRNDFISTYLERDIPFMGPQVSATHMRRFWTMLAHYHGQQMHFSEIGKSLELSHTTVRNYLDILTDFYMVRQLQPWSGNTKKRIVKAPKVYLRDSGLLHCLLKISSFSDLLGNPLSGSSWEGFVIENIVNSLNNKWRYSYYRTSDSAEIDLILEGPNNEIWAIEIKKSSAPKLQKGFHVAATDIKATQKFVIHGSTDRFPMSDNVEAIGILDFLKLLTSF